MPQPITLPNYSHMAIGSQEEIIEEHIKMNALLIICLTMVARCDTRLQVWLTWRWIAAVMVMVVAMEMRWEMAAARVCEWLLVQR